MFDVNYQRPLLQHTDDTLAIELAGRGCASKGADRLRKPTMQRKPKAIGKSSK